MSPSPENEKQRSVFDVHGVKKHDPQKHDRLKRIIYGRNVINLKPGFRSRHPWVWAGGFIIILIAAFFGIRRIFTKADVQDFYPSSCLGNWQNSANAENQPETLASQGIAFSDTNSAVYTSGTQIFCGGFLPNNIATSGQITNVGLTLVWQIGEPPAATVSPTDDDTNTTVSTTTPTTSTTDEDDSTIVATSTDTTDDASATAPDVTPDDSSSVPTLMQTPPPDPVPSSSPDTSFIRQLIPFAFAQDITSDTAADATSDVTSSPIILGPPLTATLGSASSSLDTTSTSSSSPNQAIPVPPPPPDNNFLDVSYSTDGETWVSIGEVNMQNWQQFTVTLPISDWADLQNLQIRVEGIPTTQDPIPPIYLDGMLLEVHYEAAQLLVQPDTTTSTDETSSSLDTSSAGSRMTLVNPGAQQTCEADPFSQVLPLGGTAQFTLDLHPSINGVSYDLITGHLPAGISAGFSQPSGPIAATSSITFQAETSTIPGSLNIAVIYQEHETDGSVLSNFCQLNIDVK